MGSKIRVLSDHTINKIAAGEVIENPASVVKELVENSMDAGATEICVEIKGGGRQLIRVIDNGCGMSADDALLCLERHATSKIREVDDLNALDSMGFRGEAIPSIASISKFMLLTRPKPEDGKANPGTMVLVDGGNILRSCPAECAHGTTIEVKSLFFNVPVRRKFQKSPAYDGAEILKILTLLSLGNPHIRFQLISNMENVLNAPLSLHTTFTEQLGERIQAVLGNDFYAGLSQLEEAKDNIQLCGYIGLPFCTRHNRTGQYLFINRRAVYSPLISYAIRDGYGPTLAANRHPLYVLHITLPGSLVDVNVHPQKREVRLRQDHLIKELISQGVEKALANAGASPITHLEPVSFDFSPPPFQNCDPDPSPKTQTHISNENSKGLFKQECEIWSPPPKPQPRSTEPWLFKETPRQENICLTPKVFSTLPGYILVESKKLPIFSKDGLCVIDQKCAHSRVIFEKLDNQKNDSSSIQQLLLPYTLETSPIEAAILKQHLESLNSLGIAIKEFGSHTFLVDAIPQAFEDSDVGALMLDLLKIMSEQPDPKAFQKEQKRSAAAAASRAAIHKSRFLSVEEAQSLVDQLMKCQFPFQCPYGKPTIIQISVDDLAKQFQTKGV